MILLKRDDKAFEYIGAVKDTAQEFTLSIADVEPGDYSVYSEVNNAELAREYSLVFRSKADAQSKCAKLEMVEDESNKPNKYTLLLKVFK